MRTCVVCRFAEVGCIVNLRIILHTFYDRYISHVIIIPGTEVVVLSPIARAASILVDLAYS